MAYRRRDPTANTGCVRWPVDQPGVIDTGEGGMSVYAFWTQAPDFDREDFVVCCEGFELRAELRDTPISPDPQRFERNLLGALLLGTSGGSWFDHAADRTWQAATGDLTEAGQIAVATLSRIYGREATLFTALDT